MRDLLQSTMGSSIEIKTALCDGVWHALADPTQIELVVLNLVINARDATKLGGSVTLETANVTLGAPGNPEEPAAGDYVMISVTDTGTGMTKDVLAKAFEPFFTTKDIGKGSGLGLSQVLGFAKQSGGGMRIETRVGQGTSVRVYLPRATKDTTNTAGRPLSFGRKPRAGAIILLVDDDSAVREITASILRDIGYEVVEVGSGGAALDIVNGTSVDLCGAGFRHAGNERHRGCPPIAAKAAGVADPVRDGLRRQSRIAGYRRREDHQKAVRRQRAGRKGQCRARAGVSDPTPHEPRQEIGY